MKPLAVTTENRMTAFPDFKTLSEYGYGKSTIGIWYGLFGPPRMPEAVLGRLSSELETSAQSEDYRSRLVKDGLLQRDKLTRDHTIANRERNPALAANCAGCGGEAGRLV